MKLFSRKKEAKHNEDKRVEHDLVEKIKGLGHESWKEGRVLKNEDGSYKLDAQGTKQYTPRLKEIDAVVDAQWIKENQDRVTAEEVNDKKKLFTEITSLSFEELPPSHKEDTIASCEVAAEAVVRASKNGTPMNEKFIDATADTIHERWILRNKTRVLNDIERIKEEKGYTSDKEADADPDIAERKQQLEPYFRMQFATPEKTEQQKEYDRIYVRRAIEMHTKTQAES